jgi:hypothetical protein
MRTVVDIIVIMYFGIVAVEMGVAHAGHRQPCRWSAQAWRPETSERWLRGPNADPIVTAFLQTPQLTTTTTRMASAHGLLGARPKSSIIDQGLVADVLGVLASIAEAVPVLGAPVKGSLEALKQIVQYSQVCFECTGAPVRKIVCITMPAIVANEEQQRR